MADCSVAGQPLIRGSLVIKRRGNWTAYLDEIGGAGVPSGQVTLDWLGTSCRGTVLRSGSADTSIQAYMVGGKGNGARALPAKMYDYQLPAKLVLADILRDADEAQSSTIAPSLLSRTITRYVRRAGNLGQQLDQLAGKLGVTWRFLLDGSVWLGVDDWQPAGQFQHILSEDYAPASGVVPLLPEALGLRPGQLYLGPQGGPAVSIYVGEIVYRIAPDESSATIYALNPQGLTAEGRLSQALRTVIREETAHVDWFKTHTGRVIQQRSDGSLDIELDDKNVPPLTSAGYRVLPAGAKLTIQANARCDVVFEDGDSERAVALLYQPGAGGHPVARQDDPVGWLIWTTGTVGTGGATVVISVGWSAVDPGPLTPPLFKQALHITGGSPDLSLP